MLLVCFEFIICSVMTFIRYVGADITFGLLDCVRYKEDFVILRFVISRSCSIHFTVTLAGLKNIVRYIEDFVIWKFVKSRFHCKMARLCRSHKSDFCFHRRCSFKKIIALLARNLNGTCIYSRLNLPFLFSFLFCSFCSMWL